MRSQNFISFLAVLIVFLTSTSFASVNKTMVGRYVSIENKPTQAQTDLLSQLIEVQFPQTVQTIGDAINYLLRYSGYSIVDDSHQSPSLKSTLKKLLPLVDRNFGPMSLRDGLSTLVGPAFVLIQDSLNREVNFKPKSLAIWHRG